MDIVLKILKLDPAIQKTGNWATSFVEVSLRKG